MCYQENARSSTTSISSIVLFFVIFHRAAGFLLEIGTVPLFRYMDFHILTCFSPSMSILRAHNMTGCELLGLVEPP